MWSGISGTHRHTQTHTPGQEEDWCPKQGPGQLRKEKKKTSANIAKEDENGGGLMFVTSAL